MARTSDLSRPIIEALYTEALVLADDVRAVFSQGTRSPDVSDLDTLAGGREARGGAMVRLALSSEGLKTTTRMMHVLAWLLNQRAFFSGELSASQVRQHGTLPPDREPDTEQLAMLEPETRALIEETVRLHGRIARLDHAWRQDFALESPARTFQKMIGREIGRG